MPDNSGGSAKDVGSPLFILVIECLRRKGQTKKENEMSMGREYQPKWKGVTENGNTVVLNQMTEHLYEMTVYDKDGKLIKSTILTDYERDRIPRRRNRNEVEVVETISQRDRSIP